LIEVDGTLDEIEKDSEGVKEIVGRHTPIKFSETDDLDHREYLWLVRRSLSKAVTAAAPLRVSEDVCVPPSKLPTLLEFLPSLAHEFDLRVNSYGHAGDGNLHVNFLAADESEEKQRAIAYADGKLFRRTLELGGTISGEHGIGIAKRGFLELEVSSKTMEVFRKIKYVFDPDNVINPGKIFEQE
jgi:FAD/FMN-containing dehydrogenase